MRKLILTMAVAGLGLGTVTTTFGQQSTKRTENSKQDTSDFQKFKRESEMKISDNKRKIAELKTRKKKESIEVQEKYDKKVMALEQKNNDLEKRIKGYNNSDSGKWESFKREYNHDMDELGKALKDLTVDNTK
jgi:uncharacterized protein HemX